MEYLVNILGEAAIAADPTAQLARLPASAVVPGGQERPLPAVPVGEEGWTQQLDSAEALSRSFVELKAFCEELAGEPKSSPAGGAEAGKALAATADSLAALRTERGPTAVDVVAAGDAGTDSPGQDVQQLRARAEELAAEHARLLERLKALGKEQAEVAAALARAEGRQPPGGEAAEDKHENLIAEAGAISVEIEALLAERARTTTVAGAALDGRLPDVAASCLRAERTRRRRFEDLLSGLHAALWGPEAPSFARNPAAVASARTLITRAGGLVELAWREMVQLAAETLGDGGALRASSEEMSRAAKRYKEMRKELQVNLDRLAKLEASAGVPAATPPSFVPPSRVSSQGEPSHANFSRDPPPEQSDATFSREPLPPGPCKDAAASNFTGEPEVAKEPAVQEPPAEPHKEPELAQAAEGVPAVGGPEEEVAAPRSAGGVERAEAPADDSVAAPPPAA